MGSAVAAAQEGLRECKKTSEQWTVISDRSCSAIHLVLFTVHCSLPTVQLFTSPLFTVHCSLFTVKNPLYVMERLAMQTRYCVLSTRVARYFPDDKPMPQGQPIAYLLGEDELNSDDSNFWIFSHAGLKRLIERARWKILEYASLGNTHLSTPVGSQRDERVFCLLESHYSLANVDLLHGWHDPEIGGMRWTRKQFAARINLTGLAGPDRIRMRVYMPEDLGPRRLEIAIDGEPATPAIFDTSGYHDVVRRFRSRGKRSIVVSCEVDKALPPDAAAEHSLAPLTP